MLLVLGMRSRLWNGIGRKLIRLQLINHTNSSGLGAHDHSFCGLLILHLERVNFSTIWLVKHANQTVVVKTVNQNEPNSARINVHIHIQSPMINDNIPHYPVTVHFLGAKQCDYQQDNQLKGEDSNCLKLV